MHNTMISLGLFLATLLVGYHIFLWQKLDNLCEKLSEIRSVGWTIDKESDFLSYMQMEKDENPFSYKLGTYRDRTEIVRSLRLRKKYLLTLCDYCELSHLLTRYKSNEIASSIGIEEEDDELWNRMMVYRFGPGRKPYFHYFPEFLREIRSILAMRRI